jgi:lipid-A-disaccharide synthase
MHFFISAGEPSGDLHGGNLARALRAADATVELGGLGGPCMRSAGVDLLYPLAEHAVMGLAAVVRVVPEMADLLDRVASSWHRRRPDAVVLIDYPGFHWWVAARAKAMDIPVVSFVPPQIWAWASYRARRMRRTFDHVLCALPFEEEWFASRGISARYIGHPYFDELAAQRLDATFLAGQRGLPGPVVALLPGSRNAEVRYNLETLVGTARYVLARRPDARFLFACFRESHRAAVAARIRSERLPAEAHAGRTAEIIELADACVAVSGSVGLELLYRRTPTVVVYRTTTFYRFAAWLLKKVPHISIVNVLAGREVFPEFLTDRDEPERAGVHVVRWLTDPSAKAAVVSELDRLAGDVARPGACAAAADFLLAGRTGLCRAAA